MQRAVRPDAGRHDHWHAAERQQQESITIFPLVEFHAPQVAATALVAGSEVARWRDGEMATLNIGEFSRMSGLPLAERTPFVRI